MSDKGYLSSILNRLESAVKGPVIEAFNYAVDNLRLGGNTKATNFLWYRIEGITSSNASAEFSVSHGMGIAPSKFIPVMDLSITGSQLVPLTVSRAPDSRRVYFTSASTGVTFCGYLEILMMCAWLSGYGI